MGGALILAGRAAMRTGAGKVWLGFLMADPSLLPADHQTQIPTEGLARTVADYIAGMTDAFIEQLWTRCGGK